MCALYVGLISGTKTEFTKILLSPDLGVGKKYGGSENPEICPEFPPEVPGQEAESSSCGHPGRLEGARSTKRVKA